MTKMLVIGLTGSIGMGKSTTAQIFRDLGIPVHDADAAVHAIYRTSALAPIANSFPDAVDDDGVNRMRLAQIVLSDTRALARLEAIVHPLVKADRANFLERHAKNAADVVVCDVPLLFETGSDTEMDVILVVSAPAPVQKVRVMSRAGMTEARFEAIIAKQMPDTEKRRRAHVVMDTSQGIEAARRQAIALLRSLSARAHSG
jgi:dephospho-CoA kinase